MAIYRRQRLRYALRDFFAGAGGSSQSTVGVQELGDQALRKTVLTLTNTPLPLVSITTGNGVGGLTLYSLPQGLTRVVGGSAQLSVAVATAKQADFTDGGFDMSLGIGTLAPANADALGTDATDDNICTAGTATLTSFAGAANLVSDLTTTMLAIDGTDTAMNVVLTGFVAAADIGDSKTTEALVSGRVTVVWTTLGDD